MKPALLIFSLLLLRCVSQKNNSIPYTVQQTEKTSLPIWIEYSKNVPDSIQEFTKAYFQLKGQSVISMKEAVESIMNKVSQGVNEQLQNGTIKSESEIQELVKRAGSAPVCSSLNIALFISGDKKINQFDSIKWSVNTFPITDSTLKNLKKMYYPKTDKEENVFIIWRTFLDTVLSSKLLK